MRSRFEVLEEVESGAIDDILIEEENQEKADTDQAVISGQTEKVDPTENPNDKQNKKEPRKDKNMGGKHAAENLEKTGEKPQDKKQKDNNRKVNQKATPESSNQRGKQIPHVKTSPSTSLTPPARSSKKGGESQLSKQGKQQGATQMVSPISSQGSVRGTPENAVAGHKQKMIEQIACKGDFDTNTNLREPPESGINQPRKLEFNLSLGKVASKPENAKQLTTGSAKSEKREEATAMAIDNE
ncbi:unnamed protein product [Linum trigynum]|uniref:Uncharacterized protein n=1 Tax=Linum trigynum TaxID=586398 RepID=A0AAV2FD74_9ROSI